LPPTPSPRRRRWSATRSRERQSANPGRETACAASCPSSCGRGPCR
jgi:hypothetical protein